MAYVKFWADLAENLPDSKDSDTLYFITDTGQLYKGSDLIADKTPASLANPNSLQLLDQSGTVIGTYDGSATVPLKAGAFVQISQVGDNYVISSANTTYDLQGKLNDTKTAYDIFLDDKNDETAEDKITIPVMVKSGSSAAAGLVPKPGTTEGTTKYLREDGTWVKPPNDNTLGKNIIGAAATSTENGEVAATANEVYLNHIEGTNTVKSTHKISGGGKVTVSSDENGNITITGAETTLTDLGLSNAMHYRGASSTSITNGGSETPTISGVNFTTHPLAAGDVVLYEKQEFIYNSSGKWELFGDEGSYLLEEKVYDAKLGSAGVTSTSSSQNYAVQYDKDGKLAVHVPWTDNNTTYTNEKLGSGIAEQSNTATSVTVSATLTNYKAVLGGIVAVKFKFNIPKNTTVGMSLNINSQGGKEVYYHGQLLTEAGIINANDIATFIYDGTRYHLLSVDRWHSDITTNATNIETNKTNITSLQEMLSWRAGKTGAIVT